MTITRACALSAFLALGAIDAHAQSWVLKVPRTEQQHSQWCWAGCSQMVLNYYYKYPSQCGIANWARNINYACNTAPFEWNNYANQPEYASTVANILTAWGVPAANYQGSLYWSNFKGLIDANKPMVALWSWTGGGGHFVVFSGYSDGYVHVSDPWPSNGTYYRSFNSSVSSSDRKWTSTVYVK